MPEFKNSEDELIEVARYGRWRASAVATLRSLRNTAPGAELTTTIGEIDQLLDDIATRAALSELLPSSLAGDFGLVMTILAEAGQYRFESLAEQRKKELGVWPMLDQMDALRAKAVLCAAQQLARAEFAAISGYIGEEVVPLLEGLSSRHSGDEAKERFMPFRVIQVGNIVDRLYSMRLRTADPVLIGDSNSSGLLPLIYSRKYLRFGTSGVRGRWGIDFTEESAKRVAQAMADLLMARDVPEFVPADDRSGRWVIIGYDARRNADLVARWVAEVFVGNGFPVRIASKDTPTPALVYYLTEDVKSENCAALINCTASHNPPEWQGIKFNPYQGYPAPTSLTDFIAARANELCMLQQAAAIGDLEDSSRTGRLVEFDPIAAYSNWVLSAGVNDDRIELDKEAMRSYFGQRYVVVDEMHGSGRGYLSRALGEIGISARVLRGERDPDLGGQVYANPEEPFLDCLKGAVGSTDKAMLGLAMDTDADRFGVVDSDGTYYRPNQILPMLVRYLGIDRQYRGRIVVTQTGSPLNELLAAKITGNEEFKPAEGAVPAYIGHPFYSHRLGSVGDRAPKSVFVVPVGIKYIEEQRLTDRSYRALSTPPSDWRSCLLLGGEESSGLTTKGHLTDKDGVWANLLIMDMVSYYGKSLGEIWRDTVEVAGIEFFGGGELTGKLTHTGRVDIDAVLEVKEGLINSFLDRYSELLSNSSLSGTLNVVYAGGVRYDLVELEFEDLNGGPHYLRVRSSGTEPINRIYIESSDQKMAHGLLEMALGEIRRLSLESLRSAGTYWRVADILASLEPDPEILEVCLAQIRAVGASADDLYRALTAMLPQLEARNRSIAVEWCRLLGFGPNYY